VGSPPNDWNATSKRSPRQPWAPQGVGPSEALVEAAGSGVAGLSNPDAVHITCYNYGKQGHIQDGCTEDPFGVKCKKVWHLLAMCAAFSKAPKPYWAGFGGGQQGFFPCEVPIEEMQQPIVNSATVIIDSGRLSEEEVEEEFKELVDEKWDWQVR
jgi:hypothetical protein